jgi:hypothetical protein
VHRYGPNGKLEAVVHIPTPKVTACTFGGGDLDQLFITTSQKNIDVKDEPLAGSLFSVAPGVQGVARSYLRRLNDAKHSARGGRGLRMGEDTSSCASTIGLSKH